MNNKEKLRHIVRTIINNGTLIPEETYLDELETYINKVREEQKEKDLEGVAQLAKNYRLMVQVAQTLKDGYDNLLADKWLNQPTKRFEQSIKEQDKK